MKYYIRKIVPKSIRIILRKIYITETKSVEVIDLSDLYKISKPLDVLPCQISYNEHGAYCVPLDSHHRPAAQSILSNNVWEPNTIEFIVNNSLDGDVVHAGTYFGDFLPALSKGVGENATIWAFEPNRENFRCARITIELNNIENVQLANAGLGEASSSKYIQTVDENGQALGGLSQIVQDKGSAITEHEPVEIVSIDSYIDNNRKVSILQLDVEGYEKEALEGSIMTIRRCLPIIILEVTPNSDLLTSNWFLSNISNLGYRLERELHDNIVLVCKAK